MTPPDPRFGSFSSYVVCVHPRGEDVFERGLPERDLEPVKHAYETLIAKLSPIAKGSRFGHDAVTCGARSGLANFFQV